MSEQTTGTIADAGSSDPSMEDILASIRKIIADDAEDTIDTSADTVDVRSMAEVAPVDKDQNEGLTQAEAATDDAALDFDDILIMDDDDFSVEDLEIPDAGLFAEGEGGDVVTGDASVLDAEILEILESAEVEPLGGVSVDNTSAEEVVSAAVDDIAVADAAIATMPEPATIENDDDLSSDDLMAMFEDDVDLVLNMDEGVDFNDISTPATDVSADISIDTVSGSGTAIVNRAPETEVAEDDIDLVDSLLGNEDMLSADEAALEDLIIENEAESAPQKAAGSTADDDLDLVKSLMADLTDDALHETKETAAEDTPLEESGLMDDILDLTMADEAALVGGDVIAVEEVADDAAPDLASEDGDVDSVDASINALLEIAASAEMDATGIDTVPAVDVEPAVATAIEEEVAPLEVDTSMFDGLDVDLTDTGLDLDEALADIESSLGSTDIPDLSSLEAGISTDTSGDLDIEALLPDLDAQDATPESDRGTIEAAVVTDDILDAVAGDPAAASEETLDAEDIATEVEDNSPAANASEAAPEVENVEEPVTEAAQTSEIETEMIPEQETPDMPQLVAKETILDEVTEDATAAAFASLNQVVEDKAVLAERGPRVGDIVQDALRPMLKEWLDENLKGIVERAVAKEVKRISAGK